MGGAVPLLDPGRDPGHRMAGGVGARLGDRGEAGEPLEVASGREDDMGAAGVDLGKDLRRARPEGADRFVRADARLRRARPAPRRGRRACRTAASRGNWGTSGRTASAPRHRSPGRAPASKEAKGSSSATPSRNACDRSPHRARASGRARAPFPRSSRGSRRPAPRRFRAARRCDGRRRRSGRRERPGRRRRRPSARSAR